MRNVSQIIVIIFIVQSLLLGQKSPHGKNFNVDCSNCHTMENWKVNSKNIKFEHNMTSFKLIGQHKDVQCSSCHKSLIFNDTGQSCSDCHTDIHQNSVGVNCEECHNSSSWLVTDILEIHENSRFPLLGVHQTLDCKQCHISASLLNFKPIGSTCYQCHKQQYLLATPNHKQLGYSTICEQCHSMISTSWGLTGFVHAFFPLTGGHAISDCLTCHNADSFSGLSSDCYTCHQNNYEQTNNPNHLATQFSTDCALCHSINGWVPADFKAHDALYFEIYSGEHDGEWDSCTDCHINANDYNVYSCLKCHDSNNGGDSNIKGNKVK